MKTTTIPVNIGYHCIVEWLIISYWVRLGHSRFSVQVYHLFTRFFSHGRLCIMFKIFLFKIRSSWYLFLFKIRSSWYLFLFEIRCSCSLFKKKSFLHFCSLFYFFTFLSEQSITHAKNVSHLTPVCSLL